MGLFWRVVLTLGCLVLAGPSGAQVGHLKEFKSDSCTFFIEGAPWRKNQWAHCCFEHDLRYWFGGSWADQWHADLELKKCVKKTAGSFWAESMYRAVRIGHYSPLKSPYKWGWGWKPQRGMKSLKPDEIVKIERKLNELPYDQRYIQEFWERYMAPSKTKNN